MLTIFYLVNYVYYLVNFNSKILIMLYFFKIKKYKIENKLLSLTLFRFYEYQLHILSNFSSKILIILLFLKIKNTKKNFYLSRSSLSLSLSSLPLLRVTMAHFKQSSKRDEEELMMKNKTIGTKSLAKKSTVHKLFLKKNLP